MLSTACPLEVLESRLCRRAEVAARRIRRRPLNAPNGAPFPRRAFPPPHGREAAKRRGAAGRPRRKRQTAETKLAARARTRA